jgi:hypothetical protein
LYSCPLRFWKWYDVIYFFPG